MEAADSRRSNSPGKGPPAPAPVRRWDLAVAAATACAASIAARLLGPGSDLRLALAVPALLFIPGYLLLQAVAPAPRPDRTPWARLGMAAGLSLPVLGLLALATAALPGGFRPATIAAAGAAACVALAGTAWARRIWRSRREGPVGDDLSRASHLPEET